MRDSAGGRPPKFDRDRYEQRNVVERCFNRLEQFRAPATRYAKRAAYYRATLPLVSTVLWAPHMIGRTGPSIPTSGRAPTSGHGW
jgi:transposase